MTRPLQGGDQPAEPSIAAASHGRSQASRARCSVPLRFVEHLILTLVHLDPRLTLKAQRPYLLQLVSALMPDQHPKDIGKAYHRILELYAAQMITTHAFVRPIMHLDAPPVAEIDRVLDDMIKALGYYDWTTNRLRWLRERVAGLLQRAVVLHAPKGEAVY